MQCIITEKQIKLTHYDGTKKRAHVSQILWAKENLKLSHCYGNLAIQCQMNASGTYDPLVLWLCFNLTWKGMPTYCHQSLMNEPGSSIRKVGKCVQQQFYSVYASAQSDQSHSFLTEERLGPWLPTERPSMTLIRLHICADCTYAQSDQSLRWEHMPSIPCAVSPLN